MSIARIHILQVIRQQQKFSPFAWTITQCFRDDCIVLLPITGRFLTPRLKAKFSHTRYQALGPELIPVYRQSARRWLLVTPHGGRLPLLSARPAFYLRKRSPDGATPNWSNIHLITAYYSSIYPEGTSRLHSPSSWKGELKHTEVWTVSSLFNMHCSPWSLLMTPNLIPVTTIFYVYSYKNTVSTPQRLAGIHIPCIFMSLTNTAAKRQHVIICHPAQHMRCMWNGCQYHWFIASLSAPGIILGKRSCIYSHDRHTDYDLWQMCTLQFSKALCSLTMMIIRKPSVRRSSARQFLSHIIFISLFKLSVHICKTVSNDIKQ